MTTPSITPPNDLRTRYLLRVADTCLIHAQRQSEWCGHGPILEEDIALTNMSLDLLGQARALLTHVGQGAAVPVDEDQLAFLRDERDYLNMTMAELPGRKGGRDFGDAVLRNLFLGTWLHLFWQRLQASSDAEVAAIAGKAVKEARYHVEHASGWVVRLGDGTEESTRRMGQALDSLWPYVIELFDDDQADANAVTTGLGPARSELRDAWQAAVSAVLADAKLAQPKDSAFRSTGSRGVHSEHLGYMLAEMQHLQRSYPGGKW
ncbi:MAG TPA: 1,2-phenylacetyl-CoA epoxidase subunit PaaC [Ideonella sp.]|uniref:1,2-phenylacetyl-CoA epoxidase subunit PaaC n=1 Tax=Ideonella sp. TaxID=1929293 RepID=UPI002E341B72|nr:1,2-phenylacetyl-CoA epoxidase subunit PaaC [Ideonella sp.]HEX5683252.1 1,2-phenylacetyl-CoA epoxidase subunit PaaC [Ideonella sp.]